MVYGWYSQKQAEVMGSGFATEEPRGPSIYLTTSGEKVIVTDVTREKKPFGSWDDYVYRGEVTNHVGYAAIQRKSR